MEYLDKIHCPVCGNKDSKEFSLKFERKDFNVVECEKCEFVFIPQYYREDIPYEDYRDEEVLASVRKGNNYIKYRRHRLRIKLIKKFVKSGKLYDIGVGWGHFLHTAHRMGFETEGVEISELMHHYATEDLQLEVVNGNFYNLELPVENWDVATMWDVLEHLDEPDVAVKKAYTMLKPGGYFVLQVPQIDSKVAKKQKEKWSMMSIEHVNYFSKKTIKKLLEDNGFEIVKYKSSYELKLFLMFTVLPWLKGRKNKNAGDGQKQTISNTERQNFFNKVTNIPKFFIWIGLFYHDLIYKILSLFNFGEEMIVIAKKK
ncbi:MAG: hypothetical protein C0596_08265 [Marinilabiliales bacterium]|nr:MAG: hypothetical protein C0596_08265 [Marinilabiliales bacterium]